jgi:hypothetical protein
MSSEEALAILKKVDGQLEAPPAVEARLMEAVRRRHAARERRAMIALAAALAVAVWVGRMGRTGDSPPPLPTASLRQASPVAASPAAPLRILPVPSAPPPVRLQHVAQPAPREIVTDFFPLMDVAPPLGRGQLLRVAVPASEMRAVGLPVREEQLDETVQADVLVGEEGMARAIRFVSLLK